MGVLSLWKNKPVNFMPDLMIKQASAAQKVDVTKGQVDFEIKNTFETPIGIVPNF